MDYLALDLERHYLESKAVGWGSLLGLRQERWLAARLTVVDAKKSTTTTACATSLRSPLAYQLSTYSVTQMRCPAPPLVGAALWILQGLSLAWELIDRHAETGSWRGGGTSRPRPFLIALCEQDFSDSNPFQCNQSQLYPVALRTKRRSYESRLPDADQIPTDT